MRTRLIECLCGLLLVTVLAATACSADTTAEARKIAEANRDAVVTIQLVVETKMSYSGESEKEERKVSATGTVIDPSGLVVACLSEIDPTKIYSSFMPEGEGGSRFTSDVVDLKLRTDDGTEIPADIVLRDRDLDLAFLRPKKAPETPMKFVDMSQASSPELMDEMVLLWRMGQVANRVLGARMSRIEAVITKPRTCYALESDRLGCPVFALDGKPVGTLVVKTNMSSGRGFSTSDDIMLVVMPCSTVMKVAEQAKSAQPEKQGASTEKPAAKPAAKTSTKATAKPPTKAPAQGK